MALADNFLRQIEVLEKALAAKKSGLPERLVVMVCSDDPRDIESATQAVFARYGLDRDTVEAAGSQIVEVKLPWAANRAIGIRNRKDPRVMNELRGDTSIESEDPSCIGEGFRGAKPKAEHSPDTSLTVDPIG